MPAFDRVAELLDPAPADPDLTHGYLDLLGETAPPHDAIAQRLMRSSGLPKIYERIWRPVLFGLSKGGPFGPSTAEEYALARDRLRLSGRPGATVLDVACGPGNVTRALAAGVPDDGLVVGIDASATMLASAVAGTPARVTPGGAGGAGADRRDGDAVPAGQGRTVTAGTGTGGRSSWPPAGAPARGPEVAYVRGDAVNLPFRDGSFDAVCCFGALYLFDDPWTAVAGMARVLRPGGRIVILTTLRPGLPLAGAGLGVASRLTGVRMFGATELTDALAACGFTDVERRSYGLMQFADATLT